MTSEPHLEPGTTVADRYQVEALLGAGGLAEVYRVRHVELGSLHALKLLTWRRKSLAERLLLEGRIQAQLRHPHVVGVSDVVRFEGQVGLLMEYVDGTALDQLLASSGALSWQDAMALFVPILSGVAAAHDAGVLHRDLKPANVLLARTSTGWVPKVADFGIAKVVEDEMGGGATTAGVSMGTPGYMAPEQVRDSSGVDRRTDIFALASILYEMLSGRKAFADTLGRLDVASTIDIVPRALTEVVPAIDPRVSDAIAKALARDREDRFPDCRAFAAALGIEMQPWLDPKAERAGPELSLDPRSFPPPTGNPRTGPKPGGPTLAPPTSSSQAESTLFEDAVRVDGLRSAEALAPPPARRPPRAAWIVLAAAVAGGAMLLVAAGIAGVVFVTRSGEPEIAPPPQIAIAPEQPAPLPASVAPVPAPAPVPALVRSPVPAPAPSAVPVPAPVAGASSPGSTNDAVALIEPEPAPPVAPAPVDMMARIGGRWSGKADGRPFELRILSADPQAVKAEAVFFAGSTSRKELLSGTFDPSKGLLALKSRDGQVSFAGQLTGGGLTGSYAMGGKKSLPWSVTR